MEIDYKCQRCNKVVKARVYKKAFKSRNNKGKKHNRLDCTVCGRYIKFISQHELDNLESGSDEFSHTVTLEELNFKLDLILIELNIREKGII